MKVHIPPYKKIKKKIKTYTNQMPDSFFLNLLIFSWFMIILLYWFDFCHTITWVNHRCTYVFSLLNLLPIFCPFSQSPVWVPWVIQQIPIEMSDSWLMSLCVLVTQLCLTLCDPMVCPWNSVGKNTGVGCHSLLQGIFLIWELNLGHLHCRQVLYHLSHQEKQVTNK